MSVEFKKVEGKMMYRYQTTYCNKDGVKSGMTPWQEVPEVKEEKKSLGHILHDYYFDILNHPSKQSFNDAWNKVAQKAKDEILINKDERIAEIIQENTGSHARFTARNILKFLREDC